ncbi:protein DETOXIFICATION 45, chloroplastic-like [Cucurbita maxima]|uniref:Protein DETOXIFICATION n=1 Tax=Cucurbita maxima TaxID=3661 RepID=A0A6J1JKC4_CUCMA|nr:protein DETOXIFICATION 45, chloroplastic-like [Cucurbita maxima]
MAASCHFTELTVPRIALNRRRMLDCSSALGPRHAVDFCSRFRRTISEKPNGTGKLSAGLHKDLIGPLFAGRRNAISNRFSDSLYEEEEEGGSRDRNSATVVWGKNGNYDEQSGDDVKYELVVLCLPAMAGQAMLLAGQLLETASVGKLGALELASAGVSINIFNYLSKLFNVPLLSVATSFVAEDISKHGLQHPSLDSVQREHLSSVSTALVLALGVGVFEALILYFGSGILLNAMSIPCGSSLRIQAQKFLTLRALGAPAVALYLTLQGVFRGFKDTKTLVLCLGIGNFLAVCLFPLLIYYFQLGATGAAISFVVSQYVIAFLMIWFLNKRVVLLSPKFGALQFGEYMKSGSYLFGRTLSVLTTMTVAMSMVTRQGAVPMAAHQICMQVWLAVTTLTEALATSSQVIVASAASKRDYKTAKKVASLAIKVGLLAGIILCAVLGASFHSLAPLFTKDPQVLEILRKGVLFVSGAQPLIPLAILFDGLHYGVSDFPYAAWSTVVIGTVSSCVMLYAPSSFGLYRTWLGLTLFMGLRTVAGFARYNLALELKETTV